MLFARQEIRKWGKTYTQLKVLSTAQGCRLIVRLKYVYIFLYGIAFKATFVLNFN